MLIILEGCDGAGKTTIAKNLAEILDAEIIHCTRETPNTFEYFKGIISRATTKNIIADRFCYGQFVYQEEHERKLTINHLDLLEKWMGLIDVKLIYVTSSVETIEARLKNRGEIPSMSVKEICRRYEDVFKGHIRPYIWNT